MQKPLLKFWAFCALLFPAIASFAQPAGWTRLMPITATENSGQTITNYQLRVVFNSQALIAAGHMQSNGADIRFGKQCSGTTLYNFWIEPGTINTPNTVAWVKIDTLFASQSRTFYMYYSNSAAVSASAVPGTFIGPHSSTDSVASGGSGGATNSQRGFRFTPNEDLLVTHFGKREPNGTTRFITLFNFSTQAILEQIQVSGPAAQYSYGALTNPRWLTGGTQYLLQLYQGPTDGYYFGTSSQIGQHITYGDMRYCNSCTQNTFPTSVLTNYHYGYPDMWYWTKKNVTPAPTYSVGTPGQAFLFDAGSNISGSCLVPTYTIGDTASGGGPFTYSWAPGATLNATNVAQVQATPTVTTTYSVTVTNAQGCVATDTIQISLPPRPVLTSTASTTVLCAGDSVTLSATGADAYDWQPGGYSGNPITIPVSTSTTFTLTGTDNNTGCSSTQQLSITVLPVPVVSITGNTIICPGDATTLSASGGLFYTWSNGDTTSFTTAAPALTTTYIVDVADSNGCAATDSVTVTVLPSPAVSISGNSSVCVGSAVTLTSSSGVSYLWSTGDTASSISPVPATSQTYAVTVLDSNGCVGVDSFAVAVNSLPVISISGTTSVCLGNSISLTASGASTYLWQPGNITAGTITLTPTVSGPVQVDGTDVNGCTGTATTTITVYQLPNVQITTTNSTVCFDDGPSGFNTMPLSGGILSGPGLVNNQFDPGTAGVGTHTVTYTYTDGNGCVNSASVVMTVNACVGVQENTAAAMQVYPNPAGSLLYVEYAVTGVNTIRIYDSRGRVVMTTTSADTRTELNTDGLSNGIYLLELMSEDGKRTARQVMIQH
ncbi:MAG: DUF2341 domain-containing protein [Bacteroidia bacterium]|jgi:hypothetical protein|nr:DUF2341 domain-containing protein [Bacteroidia bacterium]